MALTVIEMRALEAISDIPKLIKEQNKLLEKIADNMGKLVLSVLSEQKFEGNDVCHEILGKNEFDTEFGGRNSCGCSTLKMPSTPSRMVMVSPHPLQKWKRSNDDRTILL